MTWIPEVVVDDAGVVGDGEVGVLVLAAGLLLEEDVRLAEQVLLQLVLEGLVAGLREENASNIRMSFTSE